MFKTLDEQKMYDYLLSMAKKYQDLNKKSNNYYDWRLEAIEGSIELLNHLRDNTLPQWDLCYIEDLEEFKRGMK